MSNERSTKPTIDLLNFQGLSTKLNPDLIDHTQLVTAENCDFYHEFGSLQKMRGSSRVLSSIYTESGDAKPVSWIGFYKTQDFSGQLLRKTLAQLGTTIQEIGAGGGLTSHITGEPNKLFRDHSLFDRIMLVTGQDQFKTGNRGTFFKFDGFTTTNWGILAPGRAETVVEGFESTSGFSKAGSFATDFTTDSTISYFGDSIKLSKTGGVTNVAFIFKTGVGPFTFNDSIEDRGELRVYIPQDDFSKLDTDGRCISIYFSSANSSSFSSQTWRFDFRVGELGAGWNTLTFDFTTTPTGNVGQELGSAPTLTSIRDFKYEVRTNTSGDAVDLYFDHLVSLDQGAPDVVEGSAGAVFVPSEDSVWSYKVTYVNEYGTESNAGPATAEIDLSTGGTETLEEGFNDHTEWTVFADTSNKGDNTTIFTEGGNSVEFQKSGTSGVFGGIFRTDLSLDLTDAEDNEVFLDIWIDTDERANLASTGFTLELSSSSDTGFTENSIKFNVDKTVLNENDWTTLAFDLENPDESLGEIDLSSVVAMRLLFLTVDSATTTDATNFLKVDNFRIIKEVTSRASIELSNIPTAPSGESVKARNIYRTVAGGTEYLFLTRINDNFTTDYSDSTSDGALGVQTPPEPGLFNDNSIPPFASMVKVWKRTVFMAGDPFDPNVLYFSRDDEPESFPLINGFELDTPITGIYETSLGLIVTTETDYWRVIGDNPDYFVDKVRKGMGNVGFRAAGETRMYGWATDRDGIRLFDLRDTNKISDIISDKFDEFERTNLEFIWSTHSRARNLMIFAVPDDDNVYTDYLIYQYSGNDDVRNGWWWTLSLPEGIEFLEAEEIEDSNGDFHLYVGGNDGMIYEIFDKDSDNFVNASGTESAVTMTLKTPWIRAGTLGAEFEGATGRVRPTYVELRAREEDGEAHNWTVLCETSDGSATEETPRSSQSMNFAFPAGKSIQRHRSQNLTAGEYFRLTITNSELDKNVVFQGVRVYTDVFPGQTPIVGDSPSGQS